MATSQSQPLLSGEIFGRYRLEGECGAGAFGRVYKARDIRLERPVALKVLQEHRPNEQDWGALLQEARTASALNHPGICTVYDTGEERDRAYIAMEYLEGQTLGDALASGALPVVAALDYAAQIATALAHAHQRGVIHRDLKASNVMITAEGHVKLLDFGLARRRTPNEMEQLTQSRESLGAIGGVAGTLPYVAPEVLRGKPATAQSDLWAFGVLLYQLLSCELPFKGQTPFELSLVIMTADPAPLAADVPARVRAVVGRCLERDCARRYREAQTLLGDLKTVRRGFDFVSRRLAGRRWAIAVACVAVTLGLVAGWSFRQHPKTTPAPRALAHAPSAAPASKPEPPPGHSVAGNPGVVVWANKKSKVYHCPGDRWYRKSRNGIAMTQQEAEAAGYRPADGRSCP